MLRVQRTFSTVVPALSGYYIAGQTGLVPLIMLAATVFFLHISANALNDLGDYESDKRNAPDRVLITGVLTKQQAAVLSVSLMVFGLSLAWMLDWLLFSIAATLGVVLWMSYSFGTRLKDRPVGSFVYLSLSTSTIPFLGGFIVMRNLHTSSAALALFLVVFTSSIMIISLKDIAGDRRANKITIAVKFGERRARELAISLILVPIATYPLLWLVFGFSQIYLLYVTIPILMRLIIAFLLSKNDVNTPRVLVRILIITDFAMLALARPEPGLSWL